jgi:hypothetical protein
MSKIKIKNKTLTSYWIEFYTDQNLCTLCGNNGIIDTTNNAISPKGQEVGRKNFCICPNGQELRSQAIKSSKDKNVLP